MTLPESLDAKQAFAQSQSSISHVKPTSQASTQSEVDGASTDAATKEKALALALLGWRGDTSISIKGSDIISCEACFRRCGLWIWQPRVTAGGGDETPEDATPEFLAAEEHLAYCPWINADAQNAGRTGAAGEIELAGWETLAKLVATTARSSQPDPRPSNEPGTPLSVGAPSTSTESRDERDAKDLERWAKLKRLRKAFSVKRLRKGDKESTRNS